MSFCAICTATTADLVSRPLGKGDGPVLVCRSCDEDWPSAKDGPTLDYEPESSGGVAFRADLQRAYAAMAPQHRGAFIPEFAEERTPGWLLVRVQRKDGHGRPRDRREARLTFAGRPWARQARYLGASKQYHLFERPDPEAPDEIRRPSIDIISDLRRMAKGRK